MAESITKVGEAGVQWGAEGTAHNFYAFYPAENAGDAFVGDGDNMIRASVDNGQSSKAFRAVVGGGTTVYDGQYSLTDVQNNSAQNTASRATIFAQPDMSSSTSGFSGESSFRSPVLYSPGRFILGYIVPF